MTQVGEPVAWQRLEGVPPHDREAVARVGACVDLQTVDLVSATFALTDAGPLPTEPPSSKRPGAIGFNFEWEVSDDGLTLGCLLFLGTEFPDSAPYELVADFRLLYKIKPGTVLANQDIDQFIWWDAVFTAWPYWREYLGATLERAGIGRVVAPSLAVPG